MARVEMSLRNVILIIAVIVLLASGSAYTVFTLIGPPWGTQASEPAEKSENKALGAPGPIYNVGTMTINLSAHGMPSTRFVRAGLAFELDSEKSRRQLEQREEQVKDRVITLVRKQTPESISSDEGMDELRGQLKESIGGLLPEGNVHNVFFFDLVVQ